MENIEQPIKESTGAQVDFENGSILGKFKDATSLLNAYNNLQAEFTRKSQKLAEISKRADEPSENNDALATDNTTSVNNSLTKIEEENNINLTQSNVVGKSDNGYCEKEENVQNGDFEALLSKKLLKFAENQPSVIDNLDAIKQEIIANKKLVDMDNGIEIAYRLVKEKLKSEPAELINNPDFLNKYILSNEDIANTIIDRYIKSLAAKNVAPKIMTGEGKSMAVTPSASGPRTLSDANKIFAKMLEK